jgi:hypothetical protein
MRSARTLLPRFFALAIGATVLASASITFAAVGVKRPAPAVAPKEDGAPRPVVAVPNVTGQAYVFAKGILEEAGFAWKVTGGVDGYAVNTVARQRPLAGAVVVDTGAPTISLTLSRNAKYEERGTPENSAPYAGTRVLRPGEKLQAPAAKKRKATGAKRAKPAARRQATRQATTSAAGAGFSGGKAKRFRPPDFVVSGAPKEPQNELPLPARARMLDAWVTAHPKPSAANLKHYSYQHAWLVYGAKFGWWHGAEALEVLIRTDHRVEKLWRVSSDEEAVARRMLAQVRAARS